MAVKKQQQSVKSKPESETIGGREFGNVIEPTQAQMASGNRGLAAEPATPKKKASRKKAA